MKMIECDSWSLVSGILAMQFKCNQISTSVRIEDYILMLSIVNIEQFQDHGIIPPFFFEN